ncbi:hypothetical protein JZU68_06800 [bacterium]|jgi:hypothetical protein|nr:hypothetical protein [bacterium]
MTHEQEILVLQELQRHQQALTDIAAGKATQTPENGKETAENEFIQMMQDMNKTDFAPENEEDEFIKSMKGLNH